MRSFSVLFELLLENETKHDVSCSDTKQSGFWKMSLMLAVNSRSSFSFQGLNTNREGIQVKSEHKIRLVSDDSWRKLVSWGTLRGIFRFLHVGNCFCCFLQLMAVLAFGTCGGYTGRNVVSIFCGGSSNETLSATFTYPFRFGPVTLWNGRVKTLNEMWNCCSIKTVGNILQ